jgi:hypothetical protein
MGGANGALLRSFLVGEKTKPFRSMCFLLMQLRIALRENRGTVFGLLEAEFRSCFQAGGSL